MTQDQGLVVEDLTYPQLQWLIQTRDAAKSIIQLYIGEKIAGSPRLDQIHAAHESWFKAIKKRWKTKKHVDPGTMVNLLGVATGDYLAGSLGLEWKTVTDPFGTDLQLYVNASGYQLAIDPRNVVAKRIEGGEVDWLKSTFETIESTMRNQIDRAHRGEFD